MKFIKSIVFSFTIWILAVLLNTLLSGIWLSVFTTQFKYWPAAFFLVFIFTLVLSIPGMFIFWIVLLANWNNSLLFRLSLKSGFIISFLSSFLLYFFSDGTIKEQQLFLSVSIVLAAITSIMIHHSVIKNIVTNKITKNYA